jgi:hypothetical protein
VENDDVTTWFENQVADMLAYGPEPRAPAEESDVEVALPANIVPITASDRKTTTGA